MNRPLAVETEETLNRAHYAEPLAPIVGGPITAKLGGGGIKRSSLTSLGTGALRVNGSAGPQKVRVLKIGKRNAKK